MGLRLAVLEFKVFAAGASEWRCLRREESAPTGKRTNCPNRAATNGSALCEKRSD